jgi:hypothetical protein
MTPATTPREKNPSGERYKVELGIKMVRNVCP